MKRLRKTVTYNGKRYEVTGKSERELNTKYKALVAELESNGITADKKMTVDQLFDEWFSVECVDLKEDNIRQIRIIYKQISEQVGSLRIVHIKPSDLQKVLNLKSGYATSYVRKYRMIMKKMFKFAYVNRLVTFDPTTALTLPNTTAHHHRSITQQERDFLLRVEDQHIATIARLMLYAGLRPGEACALQWVDVDFANNELHITKSMVDDGKRIKGPKSENGIRDIPMQTPLRTFLSIHKGNPFDYVIPLLENGKPMSPRTVTSHFDKLRREFALAADFTAYNLRHTFCTDLQRAGVPINVAKDLMGHSSISITANIYTHRDSEVLHDNILKLDKITMRGKSVENAR